MKWHWSDALHNPVLKAESAHTCRRWDRIQDWALQRVHILTEEENERMKGRPKPNRGSWSP